MISKKNLAVIALALAAGVSTASAQTLLWSDNFNDDSPIGWENNSVAPFNEVNQQFVITESFPPTALSNPRDAIAYGRHPIALTPLPDAQTLEMRVDLVGANQNDALASINVFWLPEGQGYLFYKDQDEVWLIKFYNGTTSLASFFWENLPLKNENVTLVLALTRRGSDLEITTRVLDKDNANALLFERTVTDTPQADVVLPNGGVKGLKGDADLPGSPLWGANATGYYVQLLLGWGNPERASQPAAEVIFDNLEVWQYESPELKIQNAVVLSWPVTQGTFVVESASSVNGPWEAIAEPWSQIKDGKTEVSILAPDNMKLFRLRQAP